MQEKLIKALLTKEAFDKYSPHIEKHMFENGTDQGKQFYSIYEKLSEYFYDNSDDITTDELYAIHSTHLQGCMEIQREAIKECYRLIKEAKNIQPVEELLEEIHRVAVCRSASDLLEDGKLDEALSKLEHIKAVKDAVFEFKSVNIADYKEEMEKDSKWRWWIPKLDSLLQGFGPERSCLIFARPNTGKTSTLVSASIEFMNQGAKVLHLCIAEDTEVALMKRYTSAAFEVSDERVLANLEGAGSAFISKYGDKLRIHNTSHLDLHKDSFRIVEDKQTGEVKRVPIPSVETLVKQFEPDIVIYDQYQKVSCKQAKDLRSDEALAGIVRGMEELSKDYKHGFICATQAGADGEKKSNDGTKTPKKWLDSSDVYGSNTAVQGEFQSMIGVGADSEGFKYWYSPDGNKEEKRLARYFNICKNKGAMGQVVTMFNPVTCKFDEEE